LGDQNPPGPQPPANAGQPPPGVPVQPQYYAPQPQPQYGQQSYYPVAPPSNGIGTAGGVLGIIAIVLSFIPFIDFFAIVLGVLAIILGALGVQRANRMGGTGKGMAVTGVVLGIIATALSLLFIILVYSALFALHTTIQNLPNFTFSPTQT
jgi:hypothetical protein